MSKSKQSSELLLTDALTIDPGYNTGWAFWKDGHTRASGIIRLQRNVRLGDAVVKLLFMFAEFSALCKLTKAKTVIIESVARYQSIEADASLDRGDIFMLCYLVGGYVQIGSSSGAVVKLISAPEWKGQLSKQAVIERIVRRTGRTYNNHIADAVGIGLSVMGLL